MHNDLKKIIAGERITKVTTIIKSIGAFKMTVLLFTRNLNLNFALLNLIKIRHLSPTDSTLTGLNS